MSVLHNFFQWPKDKITLVSPTKISVFCLCHRVASAHIQWENPVWKGNSVWHK
jgi:hypothetical protein